MNGEVGAGDIGNKRSFCSLYRISELFPCIEYIPHSTPQAVDNVAMLHLDTVWCLFLLKDISRLSNARSRLSVARHSLQRSHGANMERMRQLQGGFCPGLAT